MEAFESVRINLIAITQMFIVFFMCAERGVDTNFFLRKFFT